MRNAAVAKQNEIAKNNEHFAEHGSIFSKKIEPFSQKEAENRMKIFIINLRFPNQRQLTKRILWDIIIVTTE